MSTWLLLLIVVTSLGHWPLQLATGVPGQKWYYVLQGLQAAGMFGAALAFAPQRRRYVWLLACLWAMFAAVLNSACGLADIFRPATVKAFTGMCDVQTGLPLFNLSVTAFALLALALVWRRN